MGFTILDIVVAIFAITGAICLIVLIPCLADECVKKFTEWRRRECKIKFLCKHEYTIDFMWYPEHEVSLVCRKCKKRKKIIMDENSFNRFEGERK